MVKEKEAKRQEDDETHTIKAVPGTPDGVLLMQAQALFGKLPATMPGSEHDTPAMIALGDKLFFEKAVSINQTIACSSCHFIENKVQDQTTARQAWVHLVNSVPATIHQC